MSFSTPTTTFGEHHQGPTTTDLSLFDNEDERFLFSCALRANIEGDYLQRDQLMHLIFTKHRSLYQQQHLTHNTQYNTSSSSIPSPPWHHRGGGNHETEEDDNRGPLSPLHSPHIRNLNNNDKAKQTAPPVPSLALPPDAAAPPPPTDCQNTARPSSKKQQQPEQLQQSKPKRNTTQGGRIVIEEPEHQQQLRDSSPLCSGRAEHKAPSSKKEHPIAVRVNVSALQQRGTALLQEYGVTSLEEAKGLLSHHRTQQASTRRESLSSPLLGRSPHSGALSEANSSIHSTRPHRLPSLFGTPDSRDHSPLRRGSLRTAAAMPLAAIRTPVLNNLVHGESSGFGCSVCASGANDESRHRFAYAAAEFLLDCLVVNDPTEASPLEAAISSRTHTEPSTATALPQFSAVLNKTPGSTLCREAETSLNHQKAPDEQHQDMKDEKIPLELLSEEVAERNHNQEHHHDRELSPNQNGSPLGELPSRSGEPTPSPKASSTTASTATIISGPAVALVSKYRIRRRASKATASAAQSVFDHLEQLDETQQDNNEASFPSRHDDNNPGPGSPMDRSFTSSFGTPSVTVSRRALQVHHKGRWMVNDRYVFMDLLGKGAQGSVWRVYDRIQRCFVAIKIVPRVKLSRSTRRVAGLCGPLGGDPSASAEGASNEGGLQLRCVTAKLRNVRVADDAVDRSQFSPIHDRSLSNSSQSVNAQGDAQDALDQSFSFSAMSLSDGVKGLREAYARGPKTDTSMNLVAEMVVGLMRHDNLLSIDEIIDDSDSPFVLFVSRLLDGPPARLTTLGETDVGPRAPEQVARWAHNIASALHELHSCGIVHCDVKLDNMLRDDARGILVLSDFGLAAVHDMTRVQVFGGGNGTFAFWAPELFQQQQGDSVSHSSASDCYALGVCLYTLLFGAFPYWTENLFSPQSWREVIPGVRGENVPLPQCKEDASSRSDKATQATQRLRIIIESLLQADPKLRMPAASIMHWTAAYAMTYQS